MRLTRASFIVTLLALTTLSLTPPAPARAGEPPAEPILRLETGMHTAKICRIAVDRAGTTLVTGSKDKTIRVWDLNTGELRKILRVPLGQAGDGMIYAVALSPDGKTVAAGGWTGWNWDGDHSI